MIQSSAFKGQTDNYSATPQLLKTVNPLIAESVWPETYLSSAAPMRGICGLADPTGQF